MCELHERTHFWVCQNGSFRFFEGDLDGVRQ